MKFGFGWVLSGSVLVLMLLLLMLNPGMVMDLFHSPTEEISLRVYCAAGIRKAFEATAEEYEKEFGVKVEPTFAGSGALLSKIRVADSGDLYLAADISYMDTARSYGLIHEVASLAKQSPVIAVRKDDPKTKDIHSIDDLVAANIRISLADPKATAISKTSKKMLKGTGKWEALWEAKLVSVGTVNMVANGILTEAVDAGIVWDATASQYPKLRMIRVPEFDVKPKKIVIAVLDSSRQPTHALRFLRYLSAKDRGLKHFQSLGYEVIDGDQWAEKPEITVFSGGLNRPAVQETIRKFEEREGVVINDSYNGCGILVGQIKTGARPDMYFACDTSFMTQVSEFFPQPFNVSGTDMVIIVNRKNQERLKIKTMKDMARDGLKIGVCHPEKSALGALTKKLLKKNSLWDDVYKNVKDTPATADRLVEHVVLDSLEAAIVYRANTTLQKDKLVILSIDDPAAHAIQPIAVAAQSPYKHLTARLMKQIRSAESQERFKQLGFEWLGETPAP